jgi:hypothetical protein
MLCLPIWSSTTQGGKQINSAPFVSVALAGHVTGGSRYCDCGTTDCVCDAGEVPAARATISDSQQGQSAPIDVDTAYTDEVELGFLAITILLLMLKLRAA